MLLLLVNIPRHLFATRFTLCNMLTVVHGLNSLCKKLPAISVFRLFTLVPLSFLSLSLESKGKKKRGTFGCILLTYITEMIQIKKHLRTKSSSKKETQFLVFWQLQGPFKVVVVSPVLSQTHRVSSPSFLANSSLSEADTRRHTEKTLSRSLNV